MRAKITASKGSHYHIIHSYEMLFTKKTEKSLEPGDYYVARMPGLSLEPRKWLGTNTERKWLILGVVHIVDTSILIGGMWGWHHDRLRHEWPFGTRRHLPTI